jgi:hypothetical protein
MGVAIKAGVIERIDNACWDVLWTAELPSAMEFITLVRVLGQPDEFDSEANHTMEANLTGPGMEGVAQVEFDLPTGEADPTHPEGWEVNALIPILMQFTARNEGTYMLDLYVDGRYQKGRSLPFRVKLGSPF